MKVGRYQIQTQLAEGGMGTVYLAHDPDLDVQVAIKVLPRWLLSDPSFLQRFEREAKIIGKLRDIPEIVPVYDFGRIDSQQPYLVMRHMAGGSLADRIERDGALTLEQATPIVERIARALDAAHTRDIVHRDVKPSNILFDEAGNAYLADFGISKLLQSNTLNTTQPIGSPHYMAPEQWDSTQTVDGRADVYALAMVTYEMLTGQTPYQVDTPLQLMHAHRELPLPELPSNFPKSLYVLLQKAVAKSSRQRTATAELFASSLISTQILLESTLQASQQSYFSPREIQRIALVLLIGLTVFLLFSNAVLDT